MKQFQSDSTENSTNYIRSYKIYADGSCIPNPGKGALSYVILHKDKVIKKHSKAYKLTTNNRMELLGVIEALKTLPPHSKAEVYLDSQYVVNSINKRWLTRWIAKSYTGVKNQDLWKQISDLITKYTVTFKWIKGHNGDIYNELCDKMAKKASNRPLNRSVRDKGYETNL